jgi:hypothetical protein
MNNRFSMVEATLVRRVLGYEPHRLSLLSEQLQLLTSFFRVAVEMAKGLPLSDFVADCRSI